VDRPSKRRRRGAGCGEVVLRKAARSVDGQTSAAWAPEAAGQGVLCAPPVRSWPPGASLDALSLLPSPRAGSRREAQCAGGRAAARRPSALDAAPGRQPPIPTPQAAAKIRLKQSQAGSASGMMGESFGSPVLSAARAARRRLGAAARLGAKTVWHAGSADPHHPESAPSRLPASPSSSYGEPIVRALNAAVAIEGGKIAR
jgi:hypothetical protein